MAIVSAEKFVQARDNGYAVNWILYNNLGDQAILRAAEAK